MLSNAVPEVGSVVLWFGTTAGRGSVVIRVLVCVWASVLATTDVSGAESIVLSRALGGGEWRWGRLGSGGETPLESAEDFVQRNGDGLLPHPDLEFVRHSIRTVRDGAVTVFQYGATHDGRVVDGYSLRLVVDTETACVLLVSRRGVDRAGSLRPAVIDGADALLIARHAQPSLEQWTEPEALWVVAGDELVAAWRLLGHERTERYDTVEIVVDARDGSVMRSQSALRRFEVEGTVTGFASPGLLPDVSYNPAQLQPLGYLTLQSGGVSAESAADGTYLLDLPTTSGTVTATLGGPWVAVQEFFTGIPLTLTSSTSAPGQLDFEFGPAADPLLVGGVNCFVHVNAAHDFIASRNASITAIDTPVVCEVGVPFPCVAGFDPFGGSLLFSTESAPGPGGCTGFAMSTIVVHEYGHFVHVSLGIQDAAFGEGYGDALGAMVVNDPISGQDVFGPGIAGRDVSTPDVQYPCSDPDPHVCGLLLAGVWWDIKEQLEASLGASTGLETARQLFVDWTAMTAGGSQAAHPGTAVEVLIVDDDNGNLVDGTPNYDAICAGFALHGIDCPAITLPPAGVEFIRGDCNRDGSFDVSDPVYGLAVQFLGGIPLCDDACDANDDGASDISDSVYALGFLFIAGPPPELPFPQCGLDPTADAASCLPAAACP